MEYMKGTTYTFSEVADMNRYDDFYFDLKINAKSINFIFNKQIIFDIPTKLFAQILKDSLEEKS